MSPLILLTIAIILVATPLSIGAARFLWQLYGEDRRAGDPRRVTLSLVLASVVTATTAAGVILAIPTVLFVLGAPDELRRSSGQLVLVAIDILLPAPVVIAAYLRRLRAHPKEDYP